MGEHQPSYHLRRSEQAITRPEELLEVIRGQRHMTLALCRDDEPYLVTVSHGYDAEARCFYFHCAAEGRKIDYLKANPIVYGQVLEDRGYRPGHCDHGYRTVQFRGRAELVADPEEKRRALALMIDQLEPDPEPVKRRRLAATRVEKATIVCVRVLEMSGKQDAGSSTPTGGSSGPTG